MHIRRPVGIKSNAFSRRTADNKYVNKNVEHFIGRILKISLNTSPISHIHMATPLTHRSFLDSADL